MRTTWTPPPKTSPKRRSTRRWRPEQKTVKETLGWDVTSEADFDKFRTEVNQLHQALNEALHSANLPKNYSGAWTESLHIIDQLLAVECRGRCLPTSEQVDNIISAAAVGAAISAMLAEIVDPILEPELVEAALTMLAVSNTFALFVIFSLAPDLIGIKSSTLRTATIAAAGAALILIHKQAGDAKTLAAAQSPPTTPKDGMKNGAKRIADQTPAQDDNPKDYDIIHDEL